MKPNILIADDEVENRNHIKNFLKERLDGNYFEASDGVEAIEILKNNRCDIAILDIKMPKKGGISVISEAIKINPCINILVVSGWSYDDVAEECLKKGAVDYLPKPVSLEVLETKIRKIINKT